MYFVSYSNLKIGWMQQVETKIRNKKALNFLLYIASLTQQNQDLHVCFCLLILHCFGYANLYAEICLETLLYCTYSLQHPFFLYILNLCTSTYSYNTHSQNILEVLSKFQRREPDKEDILAPRHSSLISPNGQKGGVIFIFYDFRK